MKNHFILLISLGVFIIGSLIGCTDSDKSMATEQGQSEEDRAIEAALTYIEVNYSYMLEHPNGLIVRSVNQAQTGWWHIRFYQYYKNVKVQYAESIAHMRPDLSMKFFDPSFYQGLNVDVIPAITLEEAVGIGQTHQLDIGGHGEIAGDEELIVFPWNDNFYLCWRYFLISDSAPARWEYFIDAHTGDIIFCINRVISL
jgi:Zn-dependent metalloprotease